MSNDQPSDSSNATDSGANSSAPANPVDALPEGPKSRRGLIAGVAAAVVVLVGAGVVYQVAKGSGSDDGTVIVKIGTTEESAAYWKPLKEAAAKENITIETVNFGDYTQANPALKQGQIDLNLFQHLQFLASYNVQAKDDLTPVGSTVVVPLPLYSKKHKSLEDIPQGGTIAIPNDATNQARALLVLQEAGLLKLKDGGNALSAPKDVLSGSKVKVEPVDAAQTVASLPSVDGSIINNNFALEGGIDPKTALFQDDPTKPAAEPYINAFVSRAKDKDNATYLKIAELYHTPAVEKAALAYSKNTAVIVKRPQGELQTILTRLEGDLRKAK